MRNVLTHKTDFPRSQVSAFGGEQVGNCFKGSGFAGSVGADQRGDFTALNGQRDVMQGHDRMIVDGCNPIYRKQDVPFWI